MSKKSTGSYYTPGLLADFLITHIWENYLSNRFSNKLRILEPSCGDGRFLQSIKKKKILNSLDDLKIDVVEKDYDELKKATAVLNSLFSHATSFEATHADFLNFKGGKYDLVIGNPPYINKKYLSREQICKCKELERGHIEDYGETKNIWPAFLLKSIELLSGDGIICLVLPGELLQVKYTRKLREYLLKKFERLEIFAFNELIFENENGEKVEQDVVVLIGVQNHQNKAEKGVSFYQVDKLEDLKIPGYIEKHSNIHRNKLDKWTNYVLEDEELNFVQSKIDELNLNPITYYCKKAEVGIVTAANKFFILRKARVSKYGLEEYVKPIISRGSYIQNKFSIRKEDIQDLNNLNKPVNLLNIDSTDKKLGKELERYLSLGERAGLSERYKMKRRNKWYSIPSIWEPDGVFSKRSHLFPRIIVNEAKCLFTDSFYRIKMKEDYRIEDLAFSFYNSLSYILVELEGRYYGGGVLELTPNEFKNCPVPFKKGISNNQICNLEKLLAENPSVESLLNFTDSIILDVLSKDDLEKLRIIRKKLVSRRLKKEII